MVNDIKRGETANCLILHDFAIERPDFKAWTEYAVDFFQQYGLVPNRLGGHRRGATKNVTFKNGLKTLEQNNYDTDLIWIGATPPNHHSDAFGSIFSVGIITRDDGTYCCYFIFDDKIVPFNQLMIDQLAIDLVKITGARYGYGLQRPFRQTVGYYWGTFLD